MFGFFGKKKRPEPSVCESDKRWIEEHVKWMIEVFGLDIPMNNAFLLPSREHFPYNNMRDPRQFEKLFAQVCCYYELDPGTIEIHLFDDLNSWHWRRSDSKGNIISTEGEYAAQEKKSKKMRVDIAESLFAEPEALIYVVSHELAHAKLLGGDYVKVNDTDMEHLTDLATIYFGFGLFIANSALVINNGYLGKRGYLPVQMIAYANALVCYVTQKDAELIRPYLNLNTLTYFYNDLEFLTATNDTLLDRATVKMADRWARDYKRFSIAISNKNYLEALDACNDLIAERPKEAWLWNNRGYAKLMLGEYASAVEDFEKAIGFDPYLDYPFNNRGYCFIKLGKLDNAYTDLITAFEINPESYTWRNLGVYWLEKGEHTKGLQYIKKAYELKPGTDTIHYYLGLAYRANNELEKAKEHFNRALELREIDQEKYDRLQIS